VLEIRENKCPHCGAPADIDDRVCPYCYANIPRGVDGDGTGSLVCMLMFAVVIGLFGLDWYLGAGVTGWIIDTCGRLSAAMEG